VKPNDGASDPKGDKDRIMDRSTLLAVLGPLPERTALGPRTLESVDCGSYVREKVEYYTEREEVVRAYVCIPKGKKTKTAAIFCHHQHDFNFVLGKSEVVGLAGDPDQNYAAELAERGYITFAPDAIAFEERNWSGGTFQAEYYELASRLVAGRTLLAKVLHDASVGIDYLESRADVDRDRIGFIGHSYGGRMAIWAPAIDKRIKASVSNCGCVSYKNSLYREAGIQMEFCVPGVMEAGDIEDVVALVAPTPLYISAGEDDKWSRGAQELFDSARSAFPGNDLRLRVWPGGHAFTRPMREEAYSFLDQHLLSRAE
jgi:dienelactone hydrolase